MNRGCFGITAGTFLAALGLEAAAQDPSDAIYNESRVATFRFTMSAASWNAICNDGNGVGATWQRADMTWQPPGGAVDTVPGVGVRFAGSFLTSPKPSVRVSFNEFEFANPAGPGTPGRKWRGVNRIKLDGHIGNTDKAMMRDRVAYGLERAMNHPAPRACHARVYVNGNYKGLYTVEEPVRKDMLRYVFGEDGGNLYELNYGGSTAYNWRGASPASYMPSPFLEHNNTPGGTYTDLVEMINSVNNFPTDQIRGRLGGQINVDGFLRHLALITVFGDGDDIAHWNGGSNNHYWYHRASTNRLEIVDWDPGASQGEHEVGGDLPGNPPFAKGQSPIGYRFEGIEMTAWVKSDATAWATLRTKIREILDGPAAGIQNRIDSIYTQVKSHAYEDQLKGIWNSSWGSDADGFTNAEYDARVAWLKDWWVKRVAYLRSQVGGGTTLPTVTIAATDPAAAEPGSAGRFTITRSGSTAAALSVWFGVGGTATSQSDFNALGTSATIPAGSASVNITVTPVDDGTVESNETVILTISSNAAYTVGNPSSATVTIADNDTAPPPLPTVTVAATDPSASESGNTGTFTVTRTGSTTSSLTVLRQRSGTATSPEDYIALPSPFVIPAGQASVTITVTPVDDTAVEGSETLIVTLLADPAYTIGAASSATVTIADNDAAPPPTLPTVTISATDPNAAEPTNTGTFTVTRTGPTAASLSVYRTRTGTATNTVDFNPLPDPMVIPAGQASVTVTLTPIDDTAVEGDETVILTLNANAAYTVGTASSATATIADNDSIPPPPPPTLPTVTITASDPSAGEPANTGTFTVTRTGPTTAPLSVYRTRTGTATNTADFNPLPDPMIIPAGQTSVTVTLTPIDDTAVEGSETVILTLNANAAYTLGTPSSATVTIADNDAAAGGLSGTYYDNEDFTGTSVTRTDPTIDFNWADQAPAPGIGADTFSIRWTGRVRAQYTETYTFYTFTNDGVRLWVEGEPLVDKWVQQSGGIEWGAQLALEAGRWYTVQMDYYEGAGNSVARLLWSSPSIPKRVIPQSALDPALGAPDSRDNDADGIPNDSDLDDDNDGIPDLQDPDRDGDGVTNLAEITSGSDANDRNSPTVGGVAAVSDGDNDNGDGPFLINDKCGGSIGAGREWAWWALALGLIVFGIRRRESSLGNDS